MNAGSIGVSVATGAIDTTRTPWLAASRARLLARVTTAPFDAAYACIPGRGLIAAVDAVMRNTPRRCFFITGRAYLAPSQTPLTLTAMTRSKIASSTRSTSSGDWGTPALAKKMSRVPHAASARSTIIWLSAARVTSARTASARPPAFSICSTIDFAPASFRSTTATRAPSRAMASAEAAPIPEPAPVITATLPSSLIMCLRTSCRARRNSGSPEPLHRESARPPPRRALPAEAGEDDTAPAEDDSLLLEPDPLRHHARCPGSTADAPLRVDHAMPGYAVVGAAKRLPDLAGRARPAGHRRELAVGGDTPTGNSSHEIQDGCTKCHAGAAPVCSS